MSKRAIVILYNGSEADKDTVANILADLDPFIQMGTKASVKLLDEEEVAMSTVGFISSYKDIRVDSSDEVKKAIMYLNHRFGDAMVGKEKSEIRFSIALSSALAQARIFNNDAELQHSVEILINNAPVIESVPKSWRNRYGFTDNIYCIVRNVFSPAMFG